MKWDQEGINRSFDKVAAALYPVQHFRRLAAGNYAYDDDGKINPLAVPVGSVLLHDEQDNGMTPSTASTTIWEDAEVSNQITLPNYGVWLVVFDGSAAVFNSAGSSSDFQLTFNGEIVASITNPAGATFGAYFRKCPKITGVPSGTAIDARVQVKSTSTGTTTAENGIIRLDIHRMG